MEDFLEHEGPVTGALEVIPKEPFLNWLNKLEVELELQKTTLDTLIDDTYIYVIKLDSYEEEIEEYLEEHFSQIFKNELETWSLEVEKWPEDRSLEVFNEWFECKVHNMVNMIKVE